MGVIYRYLSHSVPFAKLSLVGLDLDLVDQLISDCSSLYDTVS